MGRVVSKSCPSLSNNPNTPEDSRQCPEPPPIASCATNDPPLTNSGGATSALACMTSLTTNLLTILLTPKTACWLTSCSRTCSTPRTRGGCGYE